MPDDRLHISECAGDRIHLRDIAKARRCQCDKAEIDDRDLADKLSRDCRRILASDWYQRLFATRLSPQRQVVPEFETTAQGSRVATSVGGC
jgi:hypothetical protein